MSAKKQAIINKFFQPKTKDFVLSSEPLRIKPQNFLRTRNNRNVNNNLNESSSSVVISLLSSDEDDDATSNNEETSANSNKETVNKTNIELKIHNEYTIKASSSADSSFKSDDYVATAEFLDVVLQEENGPFEMKKNSLPGEFTDYKLSSFTSMIDWVLNDESNFHLINEDDWTIIENFKSMSGRSPTYTNNSRELN